MRDGDITDKDKSLGPGAGGGGGEAGGGGGDWREMEMRSDMCSPRRESGWVSGTYQQV